MIRINESLYTDIRIAKQFRELQGPTVALGIQSSFDPTTGKRYIRPRS